MCVCILLAHVAVSAERTGSFGSGSGPVLLSGVVCYWNDPSLIECRSYDPAYCYGGDDAGVICEGTIPTDIVFNFTNSINVSNFCHHYRSLCNGS